MRAASCRRHPQRPHPVGTVTSARRPGSGGKVWPRSGFAREAFVYSMAVCLTPWSPPRPSSPSQMTC